MSFLVVTEHWPRNPSKPMWFHVESRPLPDKDYAELWAHSVRERNKSKKSKCLGKTLVIQTFED